MAAPLQKKMDKDKTFRLGPDETIDFALKDVIRADESVKKLAAELAPR
jgi:hypothetical protein